MNLKAVLKSRSVAGSKITRILAGSIFLLTASFALRSTASIYTLLPGGSINPTSSAFPVGGTPEDTVVSDFTTTTLNGSVTSTVIEGDTSNPYGGLTFTYLLNLSNIGSTDSASELTAGAFAGFQTDVSFDSTAGIAPFNFSRSKTGDVLEFSWSPGVLPGQTGALIVVQTSALNFQTGTGGVIDSVPGNVSVLVPVPEPATCSLLVTGMGAFFLFRRRNSK
jgi:hypothetical protein